MSAWWALCPPDTALMEQPLPDKRALEDLGKPDAMAPVVAGDDVYDALTFAPDVVRFSRKQYQFLHAFRLGVPLSEAAAKANLSVEQAERFLNKPQTLAWLEDRALMTHIKTEWEEPAKWWAMGNEILEGTRDCSKIQLAVWENFGARIVPKKSESGGGGATNIQININPEKVREAFNRQESIDADVVKGDPL